MGVQPLNDAGDFAVFWTSFLIRVYAGWYSEQRGAAEPIFFLGWVFIDAL